MKYIAKTFFIGLLLSVGMARAQSMISITNNSQQDLVNTIVEIPWATVRAAYPQVDTARLRVVQWPDRRETAYQVVRRGPTAETLLVQLSVGLGQQVQLALLPEKPAPVPAKTVGRYVPERFDDFAWENDRIAFRIYGKALNGRKDNAFGTDVWAKRTDKLVLDRWYKSDNYHKDHGEGLDYYHVGLTLGAGDIGAWLGDSINFIHNYATWQLLDNGPLRTTFRVTYPAYTFGGSTVNTTKTISLDAGSQLSRVEVLVNHTHPTPLPMVVGISLRPQPRLVLFDQQAGVMSYWEPTHGTDGTLGIGCVFPAQPGQMHQRQQHALTELAVASGKPVVYYTGAAWDKAGVITSATAWTAYLNEFRQRLRQPLLVQVGQQLKPAKTTKR